VIKGYHFNKVNNVFKSYVDDFYSKKNKSKGMEKAINKSFLNNLLGRFGMEIYKPVTKTLSKDKLDRVLMTRKIKSIKEITQNLFLVTYEAIIDESICQSHGLDYSKVLENDSINTLDKYINTYKDVNIAIAAMTTAYARVYMLKLKLLIISLGGNLYYSDNDSLITNIALPPELVGKGIGQLKYEYEIKEGYFISNKLYALLLRDGSTVVKAKGVSDLTFDEVKSMYLGLDIKAKKSETKLNYQQGSVSIGLKEVVLNHNAYTKRDKIYSEDK